MSVADWLVYAENDLKTAKVACDEGITNNACFHAHQTVEKCLKAILLAKEQEVPKVHDLLFLLEKVRKYELTFSQFEEACRFLNQFYIPTRYPDTFPGSAAEGLPTIEDSQKATSYAEEIFKFASKLLE